MKNQKGFIQIPLLIIVIASVVIASAGAGIVLHKQGKLASLTANISEVFKGTKDTEGEIKKSEADITSDITSIIKTEGQKELRLREEEARIEAESSPSQFPRNTDIDATDLEGRVEDLENKVLNLTNKYNDLVSKYNDLLNYTKAEVLDLTTRYNNLVNIVNKLSTLRDTSDTSALEYQIKDLKSQIKDLEDITEKICKNAFVSGSFLRLPPYCSFPIISTQPSLKQEIDDLKEKIKDLEYKIKWGY